MGKQAQDQSSNEVTIPADDPSFDREALESQVSSKMDAVFGNGDDETLENLDAVPDSGKSSGTPRTHKVAPAKEPADEETKTDEATTEEAEVAPAGEQKEISTPAPENAPTLPAAYVRSLKAAQWTDEEIEAGLATNPDKFLQMAERVHATRNEETRQWALRGQQQKQPGQATVTAPAVQTQPAALQQIDVEALKKKYGDEPFVTELAKANQVIAQAQKMQEWISQSQARQSQAETETLGRQVESFFSSDELKPYSDLYGASTATMTPEQQSARVKLLDTADLISVGARGLNRNLTLDEILQRAHESVSGPVKVKAATQAITKQVKQRANAITIRPGARVSPPATSAKAKRADLETQVRGGLKQAFK